MQLLELSENEDMSQYEGKCIAAVDGEIVGVGDEWKSLYDEHPGAAIFQIKDGKLDIQGPRLIMSGQLRCPRCKNFTAGMFAKHNGWVPHYQFGCITCGLVAGEYKDYDECDGD